MMQQKYRSILLSVAAGIAAGILLSYMFYRAGLPIRPFIYQAF